MNSCWWADDERAGAEGARAVAAQVGILEDAELNKYVQGIGQKLLRGLPRRAFRYRFAVVDQTEPNAFALPGGYIYISRALLALVKQQRRATPEHPERQEPIE